MKRLARLFFYFCTFFALLCSCLIYFTHPNDKRVKLPSLEQLRVSQHYEKRAAALFLDRLDHSLDLPENVYRQMVNEFQSQNRHPMITASQRFVSPYQFFLSLGSHPEYLEGRHALAIPVGHSLKIKPALNGKLRLAFAGTATFAEAQISLQVQGQALKTMSLSPLSPPRNSQSFWYRHLGRYLQPDPELAAGGVWQNFSAPLKLHPQDELTLSCAGSTGFCILSEPQFWQITPSPNPHLLFILVDTLRYDALTPSAAPFLSRFAKEHVSFSRALAAGNMTSPSTNALLSCRKPSKLGALGFSYSLSAEEREAYYSQQQPSFPEIFTKAGWHSAMMGNISVISEVMGVGADHGFSEQIAIEREAYDTPQLTRKALEWLSQNGHQPFFLYLHYHAPHAPYRAPLQDIWATFPGWQALRSYPDILRWLYAAEVHFTDRYLKMLLEGLKSLQLFEQTTIVLTADHGDHHELRYFQDNDIGPAFTGTYFDHGTSLFDDEIRVPLVFKAPTRLKESVVISQAVSGLDLAPTLLELFALPVPAWCDGISLASAINPLPKRQLPPQNRVIGFEGFHHQGVLINARYKYIEQFHPIIKTIYPPASYLGQKTSYQSQHLLFDLQLDPHETHNLSFSHPQLLADAQQHFMRYFAPPLAFELVLETPKQELTRVRLSPSLISQLEAGSWEQLDEGTILFAADAATRKFLRSPTAFLPLPTVEIGEQALAISFTAAKLPLSTSQDRLPLELAGESPLAPVGKSPAAYIRRVKGDASQPRAISSHNPQLERLLREWGYLNDN